LNYAKQLLGLYIASKCLGMARARFRSDGALSVFLVTNGYVIYTMFSTAARVQSARLL